MVPTIEQAYTQFRPMLLGAIGKLARQGFVVDPLDAMDLIHDFYAEAWDGLTARYDPVRGSFEGYTCKAFIQFARRRIIKLQRFQQVSLEMQQGGEITRTPFDDDQMLSERQLEPLQDAIARLPALERDVLVRFLYSDPPSERQLARLYALSRYTLRETLIKALGQVALAVEGSDLISAQQRDVACALWRDRRTINETAAVLGMTPTHVRTLNARNTRYISTVMENLQRTKGLASGRKLMIPRIKQDDPQTLLTKALVSVGNQNILQEVTCRAREIADTLERSDISDSWSHDLKSLDPVWIAEVYHALAQGAETSDLEEAEPWLYAIADEERSVGQAYEDALIPGLPERLENLARWFSEYNLPVVSEDEAQELLNAPVMRACGPVTCQLAGHGATPLTVLFATEAVSSLAERLIRLGKAKEPVVIVPAEPMFIDEIGKMAESSHDMATILLPWLLQVAQFKPYLFDGFEATPDGLGIRLSVFGREYDNLYERWGLQHERAFVPKEDHEELFVPKEDVRKNFFEASS